MNLTRFKVKKIKLFELLIFCGFEIQGQVIYLIDNDEFRVLI